jgi:hypothetical protein
LPRCIIDLSAFAAHCGLGDGAWRDARGAWRDARSAEFHVEATIV